MNNWYEVLKSFDETAKGKAKAGKYHQGPAVLALMYLSLGKDYPYNMARVFQSSLSIEKSGFSVLFHNGKIASLLKEMEEKHLLIRVPDPRLEGRPRNYYKINPMIIHSDKINASDQSPVHTKERGFNIEIPVEQIKEFLTWLEKTYASEDKRRLLTVRWSFIKTFNFITFLLFLKEGASAWESSHSRNAIITSSLGSSVGKKRLSQLIEEYILKLEYKYKPETALMDIIIKSQETS